MSDRAELVIAGKTIANFVNYTAEADIFTADDAFSMELVNPEIKVIEGSRCELKINGTVELTGVVDRVVKSYDKREVKLHVEGRDLMGVLVDSHCEKFITVQNMRLSALAETLIKNVPAAYQPKGIIYQKDLTAKLKGKKVKSAQANPFLLDAPQKIGRIEPGMSIFEVLSHAAKSRGYLFWANADGTFEFGRPKTGGTPAFNIICRRDGVGNNIISGHLERNIAQRFSKIIVITQQQGQEDFLADATKINVKTTRTDATFPFYKPFVKMLSDDSQSPALHARLLMEKMRRDGFKIEYHVPGHSQNGRNWKINELCQVNDEVLEISGAYLIYKRTFERSKEHGTTTKLWLSIPGEAQ